MFRRALLALALPVLLVTAACGGDPSETDESLDDVTSATATLMQFEFDGQFTTSSNLNLKAQTKGQLFYLVGQLNAHMSVARLDRLTIVTETSTAIAGGLYLVKYHAKIPVAWGSKTNLPTSVTLRLPLRVDTTGLANFWSKYNVSCGEQIGDEITAGNFWFHIRPEQSGCALAAADTFTTVATATVHVENTTGKYPEYHRIWEDRAFRVVAVFGKYSKGATDPYDAGISAYNAFIGAVMDRMPGAIMTPNIAGNPGAANPDITIEWALSDGRRVVINALLSDEVKTAPASWIKRYGDLTPGADLIVYNGHAGLGSNIAALQNMGNFFPGQYQIAFLDGCDTFAYLDGTLAARRAPLNPDDASGTKYLDIVTNAMPAYFDNMPDATMAMINAILDDAHPQTYQAIFAKISPDHVVMATNEEDNQYYPGRAGPAWNTFAATGAVGKSQSVAYQTAVLPAGKYVFSMVPLSSQAGGDADLRVRAGAKPDATQTYKCKSYTANSDERCVLTLTSPQVVYMTVTGDKVGVNSAYEVRAWTQLP